MATKVLSLRIDEKLHEKLATLAKNDHRTINNYVTLLIERAAEQSETTSKATKKGQR